MQASLTSSAPATTSFSRFFGVAAGLLTVLGAASPAAAQQVQPVHLVQTAPATLRLRIQNPSQLAGTVQVMQLNTGQSLFSEAYTTTAYGHQFSFNHLPSGRYALLLRVGEERYRFTVRVRTHQDKSTAAVCQLRTRRATDVLMASVQGLPEAR